MPYTYHLSPLHFLEDTFASTSFDAYTRLLAQPDPTDLPRRAHVCRYEGDPNRRDTTRPGIATAWRQRRTITPQRQT